MKLSLIFLTGPEKHEELLESFKDRQTYLASSAKGKILYYVDEELTICLFFNTRSNISTNAFYYNSPSWETES